MPQHYTFGSLEHLMQVDPTFRARELTVRGLEKKVDILRSEIEELQSRLTCLEEGGHDRAAARVRHELDQAQQKLSQARADLEQAWAARDAMLGKKS